MVALGLFLVGVTILHLGPRLATASWTRQAPRLAIFTWQALTLGAVAALVLAGIAMLIPVSMLAEDLGTILHACAVSVAAAYGSSGSMPGGLVGIALGGVLPLWLVLCGARVLGRGVRDRRRLRRSLALVTELDPRRGIAILGASSPAAFCVPGRVDHIVVSRGALDALSTAELDGVLAHERAHLRGRHHLAVVLSEVLVRAFPRLWLFRVASAQTRQLIELLADDAALERVDRITLASAIVRLAEMRAPAASLAVAQDAAAVRVSRLLAPATPMGSWRYRLHAAVASGIAIAPMLVAGSPAAWAAVSDLCNI